MPDKVEKRDLSGQLRLIEVAALAMAKADSFDEYDDAFANWYRRAAARCLNAVGVIHK